MKKNRLLLLVLLIVASVFEGCRAGDKDNGETTDNSVRIVTDMSGTVVTVPKEIERYAVVWAGMTDIVAMFDGAEHMVAYPEKSTSFKMYVELYPELKNKLCLPEDGISVESILETEAQVVFLKGSDDENLVNKLRQCGIAVVDCEFKNYEGLQEVVKIVAEVFGTEDASAKAEEYGAYLDDAVNRALSFSRGLENSEKITALVIKDTIDFSAYGKTRYTGQWVEMCGADYIMVNEESYANVNLTREQLLEYDPDVLFFSMPNEAEKFLNDSSWKGMSAVKNNKVYNIPSGLNTWSNSGAESALIFDWAREIMYPELMEYSTEAIADFYEKFYQIVLSDDEIEKMVDLIH